MPLVAIAPFAPGDFITASWANTLAGNQQQLDLRTGGDPGAAGSYPKFLIAASTTSALWRALASGDFPNGVIPDAAMVNGKVSKAGDSMSGALTIYAAATPTSGVLYLGQGGTVYVSNNGSQIVLQGLPTYINNNLTVNGQIIGANDARIYRASAVNTGFIFFGASGVRYLGFDGTDIVADGGKIWTSANDGLNSGLDADTVAGLTYAQLISRPYHTGTQPPSTISPQGAGSGLNAEYVQLYAPGNASGNIPLSNFTRNVGLIADMVDGYHAVATSGPGAAGAIPVADAAGKLDAWITPSGIAGIPSGLIAMWGTTSPPVPTGWTTYVPTGGGSQTGRFPIGSGGATYIPGAWGAGTHNHRHNIDHGHANQSVANSTLQATGAGQATPAVNAAAHPHGHLFTINATGSAVNSGLGDVVEIPDWFCVTYIIKS